jgi:hypothetical protein
VGLAFRTVAKKKMVVNLNFSGENGHREDDRQLQDLAVQQDGRQVGHGPALQVVHAAWRNLDQSSEALKLYF